MLLTICGLVECIGASVADYKCICCNKEEAELYSKADATSSVTGYMYRFDCFPAYGSKQAGNLQGILFDHQVGYIAMDDQVQEKTCFGDIPEEDKLTTIVNNAASTAVVNPQTNVPPSTDTTTVPITTASSTRLYTPSSKTPSSISSTAPATSTATTTPTSSTSTATLAPTSTSASTVSSSTKVPITTPMTSTSTSTVFSSTTVSVTTSTTPTTPRPTTTSSISTIPTTSSSKPPTTSRRTFSVSTTLSTTSTRQPTTATSTPTSTSSTASTHTIPTTTTMTTKTTTWMPPTKLSVSSSKLHFDNNYLLSLCPHDQHVIIGAHGHSCYEFVYFPNTYAHAEADCKKHGGFLAEIVDSSEDYFLYRMLAKAGFDGEAWIGLHDRNNEGHWEWLSGSPVNFTHWYPGHSNIHYSQDCVIYKAGSGHGYWSDTECGTHSEGFLFHTIPVTNRYPWICQYPAPNWQQGGHQIIGPGQLCPNLPGHTSASHGNKCYELSSTYKTWNDAEGTCKQYGGHLFTVPDAYTNYFIQSMLRQDGYSGDVWMGLQDQAQEDYWQWVTGAPLTYTNWDPHLFKIRYAQYEDCAVYLSHSGTWTDTYCDVRYQGSRKYRFICEFA